MYFQNRYWMPSRPEVDTYRALVPCVAFEMFANFAVEIDSFSFARFVILSPGEIKWSPLPLGVCLMHMAYDLDQMIFRAAVITPDFWSRGSLPDRSSSLPWMSIGSMNWFCYDSIGWEPKLRTSEVQTRVVCRTFGVVISCVDFSLCQTKTSTCSVVTIGISDVRNVLIVVMFTFIHLFAVNCPTVWTAEEAECSAVRK